MTRFHRPVFESSITPKYSLSHVKDYSTSSWRLYPAGNGIRICIDIPQSAVYWLEWPDWSCCSLRDLGEFDVWPERALREHEIAVRLARGASRWAIGETRFFY